MCEVINKGWSDHTTLHQALLQLTKLKFTDFNLCARRLSINRLPSTSIDTLLIN